MAVLLDAPPTDVGALVPAWSGTPAADADGTPVGRIVDVLYGVDKCPGWVLVELPDARPVLAPARGLRHRLDGVVLGCRARAIEQAPDAQGFPGELTCSDALPLARHYGVRRGAGPWRGACEPRVRRG